MTGVLKVDSTKLESTMYCYYDNQLKQGEAVLISWALLHGWRGPVFPPTS